jgi:hypothetical protein
VEESIFGARRQSHRAVASASSRTETAIRLKGALGHSSMHTTGGPGRTATKSFPSWWPRVPTHSAPGIQTPR